MSAIDTPEMFKDLRIEIEVRDRPLWYDSKPSRRLYVTLKYLGDVLDEGFVDLEELTP